ncbi:MAG: cation:proton antiporter subunit C [Robiginitomaculum sp.]
MLTMIAEHFNYGVVIILMMTGLYVVFASDNMVKKLVGLSVFQTSVFLLYITMGKVRGGVPPIIEPTGDGGHEPVASAGHGEAAISHASEQASHGAEHAAQAGDHAVQAAEILYSNPLPHVLILTAIVVGVATLAVGLALVVRVREVYGTIEEAEIDAINYAFDLEGYNPEGEIR